jgi:hypothetical protein
MSWCTESRSVEKHSRVATISKPAEKKTSAWAAMSSMPKPVNCKATEFMISLKGPILYKIDNYVMVLFQCSDRKTEKNNEKYWPKRAVIHTRSFRCIFNSYKILTAYLVKIHPED